MNIHEYQAKQLFSSYGINVLKGDIAVNVNDAIKIAESIFGKTINRKIMKEKKFIDFSLFSFQSSKIMKPATMKLFHRLILH